MLVTEDYDTHKNQNFCVPLGGHVKFNEHSLETVKREFIEEINAELTNLNLFTVLENFFTWNGTPGHEVVFVYKGELKDKSLYNKQDIPFLDTHYPNTKVKWVSVKEITQGKHNFYPEGLRDKIIL